jgi:hypothetical protein
VYIRTPEATRLSLWKYSNLSDFFRPYLHRFLEGHMLPRPDVDGRACRYTSDQVSHLWIDAICTDQSNSTQEKATQIPLMEEIYSHAGRVLAWLGADESRLDTVCWLHEVVLPLLRRFVVNPDTWSHKPEALDVLEGYDPRTTDVWTDVIGLKEEPPTIAGS